MTLIKKAVQLPRNYPAQPARYPLSMFRLQLLAAARYLFEGELREALTLANIPLDALTNGSDPALNVAQVAAFMQELKEIVGDEKALQFGREAFLKVAPSLSRPTLPPVNRAVSSSDKLFLRIRESFAALNRQCGSNFLVKWHGGAECDIFEDSGQHCYGYAGQSMACQTLTGYLQEASGYLSNVKMTVVESECMVTGALACRWHCNLT